MIVAVVTWSQFLSGLFLLSTQARMDDFTLNLACANSVCEHLQYPLNFPYPLPAVLLWRFFGSLGYPVGTLAWLLVLPASMIGCLFLSASLAGGRGRRFVGVKMAIAFAAVQYFLIWDLRTSNINSFYLVLVLLGAWCWQRNKPTWAGVLLAASVSVKVYSIVFLLYLALRKEWRISVTFVLSLLASFVALPVLYFGWHDAALLTTEWVQAVQTTSRPDFMLTYDAYKVSLAWVALVLMNPEASAGKLNLLHWSYESITWTVRLVCLAWALIIGAYFASLSFRREPGPRGLVFALDVSVLLLCTFPASPFLQPHHLVALLVPAVCLIHVLFDPGFPTRLRATAGLTVAMGSCLTEFGPRYPLRGLGILSTVVVYLAGIWIIRRWCDTSIKSPTSRTDDLR